MGPCCHAGALRDGTHVGLPLVPVCRYFTMTTMTSTGYGDVLPVASIGEWVFTMAARPDA